MTRRALQSRPGGLVMHKRTSAVIATLVLVPVAVAAYVSQSGAETKTPAVTPAVVDTPTTIAAGKITASSTTDQTVGMPKTQLNLAVVPLGTGKGSTTAKVGYLDRCGGVPSGGPPVKIPPWVDETAATWNAKTKVAVQGSVSWKSVFKVTHVGTNQVFTGNGLPKRSGTFPVAQSDPAYAYNPNPGAITAHSLKLSVPYNPKVNSSVRCEMGVVGIAIDGIPIFDGFDAGGNDASGVEGQDTCHGHPNTAATTTTRSRCICRRRHARMRRRSVGRSTGWDLRGVQRQGSAAQELEPRRVSRPQELRALAREAQVVYHYDMTFEFPYSVGCFGADSTPFFR